MLNKATLLIDCEWNGFFGDFISMALVPVHDAPPFYAAVSYQRMELDPWVAENVIPVLNTEPLPDHFAFQRKLEEYLSQWDEVCIIADWPEDIKHFCDMLITGPGTAIKRPTLSFKIIPMSTNSAIPHNALEDAIANRDYVVFRNLI